MAELEHDEHEGLDEASLLEHEEITKVKNVANVLFGKYIIECWYFSPFPKVRSKKNESRNAWCTWSIRHQVSQNCLCFQWRSDIFRWWNILQKSTFDENFEFWSFDPTPTVEIMLCLLHLILCSLYIIHCSPLLSYTIQLHNSYWSDWS